MTTRYYGDHTYGQKELQNLLRFLHHNGYEFTQLEQSEYIGVMDAVFRKDIMYTDMRGDAIGDREIKVTVTVDSDFDWKNTYSRDDNENVDFSRENRRRGETFVNNLITKTYDGDNKRTKKNKTRRRT